MSESLPSDAFEVRMECMVCGHLWFVTTDRDSAYEVEDQIAEHVHREEERALLVTGHAFIRKVRDIKGHSRQGPFDLACRLMGIDWMTRKEVTQAVPPAFTEFIGSQLLAHLGVAA